MSDLPIPKDPMSTAIEKSIEEAAKVAMHYVDKLVAPALKRVEASSATLWHTGDLRTRLTLY